MTDAVHTPAIAYSAPRATGQVLARLGTGLRRLGARLIEVRMRQAEAVVAERRNWIEGTRVATAPHDADSYFP